VPSFGSLMGTPAKLSYQIVRLNESAGPDPLKYRPTKCTLLQLDGLLALSLAREVVGGAHDDARVVDVLCRHRSLGIGLALLLVIALGLLLPGCDVPVCAPSWVRVIDNEPLALAYSARWPIGRVR
jgi:hypothetical protein